MCTVKKDFNIPEVPMTLDSPPPVSHPGKVPSSSSVDYDLINRQQSQLLLDMIYASSVKKPCFFNSKLPCPGTVAAAAAASASADKSLNEEIAKIKTTLAEIQSTLKTLPAAIVASILETGHCSQIRDTIDFESDLEDFDKLSSVSTPSLVTSATTRTSMSSDIEVLNFCSGRPACASGGPSGCPSSAVRSPLPLVDISKEILQLSNSLKALEFASLTSSSSNSSHVTTPQTLAPGAGKDIARSLFSHWENRYQTSKATVERANQSSAPMGNIRSSPSNQQLFSEPAKILPYNSTIDLKVWLK